jgi:hypothetical protein
LIDGEYIENMLASLNKTFAPLHKLVEQTKQMTFDGPCEHGSTRNRQEWRSDRGSIKKGQPVSFNLSMFGRPHVPTSNAGGGKAVVGVAAKTYTQKSKAQSLVLRMNAVVCRSLGWSAKDMIAPRGHASRIVVALTKQPPGTRGFILHKSCPSPNSSFYVALRHDVFTQDMYRWINRSENYGLKAKEVPYEVQDGVLFVVLDQPMEA